MNGESFTRTRPSAGDSRMGPELSQAGVLRPFDPILDGARRFRQGGAPYSSARIGHFGTLRKEWATSRGRSLFGPPARAHNSTMERPSLQLSVTSLLGLVACVALNIWLFRLGPLLGILGLNISKHVIIAYVCKVVGVDKTHRRNQGVPVTSTRLPRS